MATTEVSIPNGPGKQNWSIDDFNKFQKAVSTILDAGNDVKFIDADGDNAEIEQIHLNADGDVKSRNLSQEDSDAIPLLFLGGGWHTHRTHFIFATGTDLALSLSVRMIQKPY